MARPYAVTTRLQDADRAVLLEWVRRRKTAQALALRARIALACAEPGATNTAIAAALGLSLMTVSKWRRRFAQHGLPGLDDAPGSGAPRTILDAQVEAVITTTLESVPDGATHWSTRLLATHLGLSQTTISRIWRAFALVPHRTEGFKLSTDPHFVDKVRDIVRPLPASARAGTGPLRGREALGSGAERHVTGHSHAPGAAGASYPRLHSP